MPSIEPSILSIQHREFGLEEFKVEDARCNLYKDDSGIWEFVVSVSSGEAIIRSKELKDIIAAEPNLEATVIIAEENLSLIQGKILVQQEGYDYEREQNLSNIYYFSHNSIEELRIELIDVTDEWIDANLTCTAVINGSNGTQPDAKISIRAKFKRDKSLKRGIN